MTEAALIAESANRSACGTESTPLREALSLPNGARFYRCALQVNPYSYITRQNKSTAFASESDYNAAIIRKCLERDIEVIAVTDHYRFDGSKGLISAARKAGIFAFGGFEASTKEGVHFLCLFDPDKDEKLTSYISECGVHDSTNPSPLGDKDCEALLASIQAKGGICIAAHALRDGGGLFTTLRGQALIRVWKSDELLSCAIAGPVANTGKHRSILENTDPNYRRNRTMAVINANDVSSPEGLDDPNATCRIKMSLPSVEALRQAFLDPSSRIRLNTDVEPAPHAEFVAISWEGGFLDGTRLHFNADLNVLVGGRGTGKSTIIESVRYLLALDALGDDARKAHESIVRHVLKPGTKISLLVRSYHPNERCYTIERTVPNPSIVKDEKGDLLSVAPRDIVGGIELFGQHEISELTKDKEKLTLLLGRFAKQSPSTPARKSRLVLELERSRSRIQEVQRELDLVRERLAVLPGLEETLKRYREAGLEDKLKEKSLLVREERVLKTAQERLLPLKSLQQELSSACLIDTAFLSEKSLQELPNSKLLATLKTILVELSDKAGSMSKDLAQVIEATEAQLRAVSTKWLEQRKKVDEAYERLLRELQKSKVDGEEFIRLRRNIEDLRPLKERESALQRDMQLLQTQRRKLLTEWEDLKSEEFRSLDKASASVSGKLQNQVRVTVTMAGSISPLERLLRDEVGGNLGPTFERLRRPGLSLADLAAACYEGSEALISRYHLTRPTADRWVQAMPQLAMKIEELELPHTTEIELNTAIDEAPPSWQKLDDLSTGQKATAVLLLLLLESDAPLIVDQPEDDLDNRFISDGVVPTMRDEKTRRQFVFSTHNANIPVLGDAELIIGLQTGVKGSVVQGFAPSDRMGSIDARPVRELVEEVLEGGKAAFEMRRLKYGF